MDIRQWRIKRLKQSSRELPDLTWGIYQPGWQDTPIAQCQSFQQAIAVLPVFQYANAMTIRRGLRGIHTDPSIGLIPATVLGNYLASKTMTAPVNPDKKTTYTITPRKD